MENLNEIVAFSIIDEDGKFIGIEDKNGKEIMITENVYQKIASFNNVKFFVPGKNEKHMKFIRPTEFLVGDPNDNNILKVMLCPPYFRYGVKVKNKLVTRVFSIKKKEFFGKEVVGMLEIVIQTNKKNNEKRFIINLEPQKILSREDGEVLSLKIGGKSNRKTIFGIIISGTDQVLRIVK